MDTERTEATPSPEAWAAALALYRRRKTGVRQLRHFPESMRWNQTARLEAVGTDSTDTLKGNGQDPRGQAKARLDEVAGILGDIPAKSISPQDIQRLRVRLSETPARGRKDIEGQGRPRRRERWPTSLRSFLRPTHAWGGAIPPVVGTANRSSPRGSTTIKSK